MSWQVGQTCYGSQLAANSAAASSQMGVVVSHGASVYVTSIASVDAAGVTYAFTPLSGGAPITMSVPMQAPACGLLGVDDGAQLGALVSLAWFATWGVMFIARAIRETIGNDDDS